MDLNFALMNNLVCRMLKTKKMFKMLFMGENSVVMYLSVLRIFICSRLQLPTQQYIYIFYIHDAENKVQQL